MLLEVERQQFVHGVILNCGVYDVSSIPNAPGIEGWGFRTALWAYLGSKNWAHTADGNQMSTIGWLGTVTAG